MGDNQTVNPPGLFLRKKIEYFSQKLNISLDKYNGLFCVHDIYLPLRGLLPFFSLKGAKKTKDAEGKSPLRPLLPSAPLRKEVKPEAKKLF